ncbi:MAG: hypothetical protein L6Q83_00990 [Gammaproteobacteria bacterium]|nr:hypothetical protein [Gammaproteobacteria bacterium]
MSAASDWIAGRRPIRIALIALMFPMPLLAVVSAALVVSGSIARGWRSAAVDCAGALLVLVGLTALTGGIWFETGVGAALTWGVAVLLGQLFNRGSMTLALQVAVLLGAAGALAFTIWSEDPEGFWEQVLADLVVRAQSAGMEVAPTDLLPVAAGLMTGMMAASAVASSMAALFVGCWLTAMAPGRSFAEEFRDIRMGRVLGGLAVILAVLFVLGQGTAVDDLLLVLATGFVVQGLAIIHWHGARRNWPRFWLFALYLPMVLNPAIAAAELALLALLGLVDNVYSLRRARDELV